MPKDTHVPTIPALILEKTPGIAIVRDIMLVVAASLLLAVSAQIAVPLGFTPVPMTLQPLAVLLIGAALGSWRGSMAVALYLFEGASGLPVFAQGRGGLVWLVGPTAGYLFAFLPAAWVVGKCSERGWMRAIEGTVAAMVLGILTIHIGGWSWLAGPMGLGPQAAFFAGTAPFLAGDVVKVLIGALVLPLAQSFVEKTYLSRNC